MTSRTAVLMSFTSFAILGSLAFVTPASALSMKECSAKYKTAQTAGTLNGMKWNDFRKAECGTDAAAAPAATAPAPKTTAAAPAAKTTTGSAPAARTTTGSAPAAKPVETGNAVFPSAVSAKYS